MIEPATVEKLFKAIEPAPLTGWEFRLLAMQALDQLPTYNWSGVYRLEGETLVLDAYAGASTEHTRIPVGRGVCGTAVAENRNMVVEDVRSLENYLACSLETRS
jgi:L-methionine (R)-S-oxide reductase